MTYIFHDYSEMFSFKWTNVLVDIISIHLSSHDHKQQEESNAYPSHGRNRLLWGDVQPNMLLYSVSYHYQDYLVI